jgi:hypothetical protein
MKKLTPVFNVKFFFFFSNNVRLFYITSRMAKKKKKSPSRLPFPCLQLQGEKLPPLSSKFHLHVDEAVGEAVALLVDGAGGEAGFGEENGGEMNQPAGLAG